MSEVNISRFVETTIKERTTVYSPLIEAIVNSIEAIMETKRSDGNIFITPIRNPQISFQTDVLPDIVGFIVEDNGIGFNKENRDAFNTLCTDYKIEMGGKGLGRFIFLKYFKKVKINSIYESNGKYYLRKFSLGSRNDIIENEIDQETEAYDTKTQLFLEDLRRYDYDKELDTIARKILERILVFFINDSFKCPTIILKENDNTVVLNNLIGDSKEIQHVHSDKFSLRGYETPEEKENLHEFQVKIYKIIYPGTITSKLCLTGHGRQVTETSLHKYIPEFRDNFYETTDNIDRNYIIRAYILGRYLDENVSLDRGEFNFPDEESDILYPISQRAIEKEAAKIIENVFKDQVKVRRNKKYEAAKKYVDESAPWHKPYLKDLDIITLPYEPDEEAIEAALQSVKFRKEQLAKAELKKIMDNPKTDMFAKTNDLVKSIQEAGSSDLTHYIALRKIVLELLKTRLEIQDNGKYDKEADIHNIVFPMKSDSETAQYIDHNLWILDEKLNFTEYVSSDKAIDKEGRSRPDLLIFNKRIAYRSGNERSNPITIFEFKQPQRDDFVNQSAGEDPIEQLIRYTRDIREGKYKTPEGRDIYVDENTPFYGYLICDFTSKVKDWLRFIKEFTPMPDGQGYFNWFPNNRLYMEVLAWDKILRDAEQRNKIFFKKLGLI